MKYYMRVLQPDEKIKYVAKLHWILYVHSILTGILALALAAFASSLSEDRKYLGFAGAAILLVLAFLSFVGSWFKRWTTEIVATDKRVIVKHGFIARRTQEMNIGKVETVDVSQGIWGRILGYGNVAIVGTGASLEPLRRVASPLQLRNAIIVG